MQDIINSFKAHLYERTNSPLIGAFIFYWLIYNYKIIVILFDSKLESKNKFIEIDKLYENDILSISNIIDIPLDRLLIPLIITLTYILIFPFISNLIHKGWVWHQNELKRISNGKVLTKREFGDLQRRFTELELSFDDTFSKKDIEINQLKSLLTEKDELILNLKKENNKYAETINKNKEIVSKGENNLKEKERLNQEINKLKEENNKLKEIHLKYPDKAVKGLDKTEINILTTIGNNNYYNIDNIQNQFKLHKIKADLIKDKLIRERLIEKHSTAGGNNYKLTEKTTLLLLENNLI